MALIKCPDCGKEVSQSAPACVGCGRVITTQTVRREGAKYELMGFFLIILSTGGCSMAIVSDAGYGIAGVVLFVVGLVVFTYGRCK